MASFGDARIELRGLRLLANVGVPDAERAVPQPIEIDVDVHVDMRAAIASDAMADSVDYGMVCDVVSNACAAPAALLETMAGRVGEAVLDADPRITEATVVVTKLRPPVPHDLSTAAARLTASRR